jgi:hypothetical protein
VLLSLLLDAPLFLLGFDLSSLFFTLLGLLLAFLIPHTLLLLVLFSALGSLHCHLLSLDHPLYVFD